MVRTRSASRFALLELNDDLLRTVLLFCEVDTLRALHRTHTRCLKIARETLRLTRWRELPGNTDALRTALWAAGQFTTRLIGIADNSIDDAKILDDRIVVSACTDEIFSYDRMTARMVFAITRIEVNRIALQGNLIAVGLMRNENSAVRLYERLANEEGPGPPFTHRPQLIKELDTVGWNCSGLGWLGPGVLVTQTADEEDFALQVWKGPDWEPSVTRRDDCDGAIAVAQPVEGGWAEPWENGISLVVQEAEQRILTAYTAHAARDADEYPAAVLQEWDAELAETQKFEFFRLGEEEDGCEWLSKDSQAIVASGDYCVGVLTRGVVREEDAELFVWKHQDLIDDEAIDQDEAMEWYSFPVVNRLAFTVQLVGDTLVCSTSDAGYSCLEIHSVSQRAALRSIRWPIRTINGATSTTRTVNDAYHQRLELCHIHGFDVTGGTLVFSMESPMDDSVTMSSGNEEYALDELPIEELRTERGQPKVIVHELSGIW